MQQQNTQVIILLATYNGEQYICQQIDSIIDQSYSDWKIIISDDGSKDSTLSILAAYQEKYPDRINILSGHEPFKNAKDNFFFLMEHSEGDFFMFCDQDDVWKKNKIELTLKKMKLLEKEFGVGKPLLVHTDLEVDDANMNIIASSFMKYSKINGNNTAMHQLIIQNVVTGCTIMMNNSLKQLALKCKDYTKILMHDWWIALVASAFGHIAFVDTATIKYRQHGKNSIGAKRYTKNPVLLIKKAFEDIRQPIINATHQAGCFLQTYNDILSRNDRNLLLCFTNLYEKRKRTRLTLMIKYKIFKYGILRKIAQIIWG